MFFDVEVILKFVYHTKIIIFVTLKDFSDLVLFFLEQKKRINFLHYAPYLPQPQHMLVTVGAL